jgi:hypothetical protein
MYTRNEELDTTRSNKLGVSNKETVTNNRYQKLVMKNQGRRTDYVNGITKNQLRKRHYLKMVVKEWL